MTIHNVAVLLAVDADTDHAGRDIAALLHQAANFAEANIAIAAYPEPSEWRIETHDVAPGCQIVLYHGSTS